MQNSKHTVPLVMPARIVPRSSELFKMVYRLLAILILTPMIGQRSSAESDRGPEKRNFHVGLSYVVEDTDFKTELQWCHGVECREAEQILESEAVKASQLKYRATPHKVESKLFDFLSSTSKIKDLSTYALIKDLILQRCKENNDRHNNLSCDDFWKKIKKGHICKSLQQLRRFCPFTNPKCTIEGEAFRTIDGTCNNKLHPLTGSAGRAFQRLLDPDYSDCLGQPRTAPGGLPSAREISNTIFQSDILPKSRTVTLLHMNYGQLLDHDSDITPVAKLKDKSSGSVCNPGELIDVECGESGCETKGSVNRNCFPIDIPDNDKVFKNKECLMFVRSEEVPQDDCSPSPRQQPNDITSWLDASFVYGSENDEALFLRTEMDGKLKSTPHPFNSKFLPLLPRQKDKSCRGTQGEIECFLAGDRRQNEHVGLQALHTVFMRYHNYIADNLKLKHPQWGDEKLYQQSRRILGAVWQMTVYNEYLPPLLGQDFMTAFELNPRKSGFFRGYDNDIAETNPDATNAFATAAFRFGHSQISDRFLFSDPSLKHTEAVFFTKLQFNPTKIYKSGILNNEISGVNAVTIGMTAQPADKSDTLFTKQVAGFLFTDSPPMGAGTDLPALNIQRGRDHGLPGYTRWRAWCNDVLLEYGLDEYIMIVPTTFDDLKDNIKQSKISKLEQLFNNVDDIDLFTGGVLEDNILGGLVGPTFPCIIAKEMFNKKFGDRFYFETKTRSPGFTRAQLNNIREQTISGIFCKTLEDCPKNSDLELNFQKYVLLRPYEEAYEALSESGVCEKEKLAKLALYKGEANSREPCSQHPQLDFDLF